MPENAYSIQTADNYSLIRNPGGPTLGMHRLCIKEQDGLAFKNLSGEAALQPYEDWRLPCRIRAEDLAKRLTVEQIAGLMLWSPHQMVPFLPGGPFKGHYNGGSFRSGMEPATLTDEQKQFVQTQQIRNILLTTTESAATAARWNNRLQALAEESPLGIPVCISSDPRHAAGKKTAEFAGTGKDVSRWPEGLGLAATFDPELVKQFAAIAAEEYRALGITQALGPQIDLATDPRWMRFEDTFGCNADILPITLQYRPYRAKAAREHSIAKGDFRENDCDRSYNGKTNTARNETDLDNILAARDAMGTKPVIVVMQIHNAPVVSEFEPYTDGLIAHFGVENKILLEILTGQSTPGGRLPLVMPKDMETVERHCEDIADDMEAYTDSCGNQYGYGFGLCSFST